MAAEFFFETLLARARSNIENPRAFKQHRPPDRDLANEGALGLSRDHRRTEILLIETLEEIDRLKLFKALGYSSLFTYAVQALGFSEAVAYSFITVARKTRESAPLKEALRAQTLSVAKASRIASVLSADNARELIDFAATRTTRETDLEVARLANRSGKERKVTVKISSETAELLKRAQSVIASKRGEQIDAKAALVLALEDYLNRHDPVRKAERSRASSARTERTDFARKPLTARQKHAVFLRDGGRCGFVDSHGQRCMNDKWIHIHHVQPVSKGGTNALSNLSTVCSFHHDLTHQLSIPQQLRAPHRPYAS